MARAVTMMAKARRKPGTGMGMRKPNTRKMSMGTRKRRFVFLVSISYAANNTLDGKSLGELDLKLLHEYTLKVEDHLSDRTFHQLAKAFPNSSQDSLKMKKKHV